MLIHIRLEDNLDQMFSIVSLYIIFFTYNILNVILSGIGFFMCDQEIVERLDYIIYLKECLLL